MASSSSIVAQILSVVLILAVFSQISFAQTTCSADGDCFQQCPEGQYAGCWFVGEMGGDSTCHCFYTNDFGIGDILMISLPGQGDHPEDNLKYFSSHNRSAFSSFTIDISRSTPYGVTSPPNTTFLAL